jgi:hypothetical protein
MDMQQCQQVLAKIAVPQKKKLWGADSDDEGEPASAEATLV